MKLVEQHVIKRADPRYRRIDDAAFASKNLWNAANYRVRQSFIFGGVYLNNIAVFHLIKGHEAYQALPRKVSNQVLLQLHKAWVGFFAAMEEWHEHPERFTGRPNLPGYKHKTEGRNLLVYEKGAIWKRELELGVIALTDQDALVCTAQSRETVSAGTHGPERRSLRHRGRLPARAETCERRSCLFVAIDLGVSVLAALTSNKPGFIPRFVNGQPIKSRNQFTTNNAPTIRRTCQGEPIHLAPARSHHDEAQSPYPA